MDRFAHTTPMGDREFGGHGPDIFIEASIKPAASGSHLLLSVRFQAVETEADLDRSEVGNH